MKAKVVDDIQITYTLTQQELVNAGQTAKNFLKASEERIKQLGIMDNMDSLIDFKAFLQVLADIPWQRDS